MLDIVFEATSRFGKRIRLTRTIWRKIRLRHPEFRRQDYLGEIQQAVEHPAYVVQGWSGEHLCLRWCTMAPGAPKYPCVVYRELDGEGFIVTAFFVSRYDRLLSRGVLWPQS